MTTQSRRAAWCVFLWGVALLASEAATFSGSILLPDGKPVPYAFVGLMSDSFTMVGQASSGESGEFAIEGTAPGGYLVVQPPPAIGDDGLGFYAAQPRIYEVEDATTAKIVIPACGCMVLRGYDTSGQILRWEDFEKRGAFSRQFFMVTNLDDEVQPFVAWPVYDETARGTGSRREMGLPAIVAEPGGPYVAHVLFWDVPGYGKLHLRADSEGEGFRISSPGEGLVLDVNVELARTAVHDLERRCGALLRDASTPSALPAIAGLRAALDAAMAKDVPAERAAAADTVLAEALRLRDSLETAGAKAAIPLVRKGVLEVRVEDASGNPIEGAQVTIRQRTHQFLFGVFEGSPYNASAFRTARKAGFEYATVLLGWGWTDAGDGLPSFLDVNRTFGITELQELGYRTKAHGVVWLQKYGILPERALSMAHEELVGAALKQADALINVLGPYISVWEAMNEPAATNEVGMPRDLVNVLLGRSGGVIKSYPGLTSLVNSAHEVTYGTSFMFYRLDNQPVQPFPVTYSAALDRAAAAGALDTIDVIGLQFYPGFHFNEAFGGMQGPATPPARLADLVDRYTRFGKAIHITEFSMPSTYGKDWTSGYWREPWTEETQADYAEMALTIAFGHPSVTSLTWWDVMDTKPSVITGGLVNASGKPKPVLERLEALIRGWTTEASARTGAEGNAVLEGFGGDYEVTVVFPDGRSLTESAPIAERQAAAVTIKKPQA